MDFTALLTNRYTLVYLVILLTAIIVLSLYYGLTYMRVGRTKNKRATQILPPSDDRLPSVSIVMVTHNEAAYLKDSLPYLLEQDYPDYEVVMVDYLSHDDTPFVLKVCSENYDNFKPVSFPEDVNMFQGKKYPLSIGIQSAKGDVILLTDPDCVPRSLTWVREMMKGYSVPGVKMVMSYAGIKQEKGLLNLFQQYDNLCDTASWMSASLSGHPYTATGRNLSYRRDFFFAQGAFCSHYSEPEGADDMFVNQNANGSNSILSLESGGFVDMEAKESFRQWRLLRRRRYATKRYYPTATKLRLALHPIAMVLFYAAIATLLVQSVCPWFIPTALFVLTWTWQIVTFSRLTKRFEIKRVHFFAPLFEIYFLLSNTILFFLALSKKNIRCR